VAKYVELLFRFRIRFAALLVLLPAILGAATVVLFPTYRAIADLWVDNPNYFGATFTPIGWNQYLTPAQNQADTLSQLLGTDAFATGLGDGLAASGVVTDQAERKQVVASVATQLKINATGSHLLTLTMTCDRAPVCTEVLTETIDLFRLQQAKLEQSQAEVGITFLSNQLNDAQAGLKSAQDAESKYLADHPGLKADAISASTNPELARLMADVQQKTVNVQDLQSRLNGVQYLSSASAKLVDIGTRVIDAPHISKGGLIGDGSSLKRAALAGLVCVAIGVGYLFLMSWMDKTTRDLKELERYLKVPVVVTIPVLDLSRKSLADRSGK
jgi:uncharacterized protein involved in exopolysaccharide biosynthesis